MGLEKILRGYNYFPFSECYFMMPLTGFCVKSKLAKLTIRALVRLGLIGLFYMNMEAYISECCPD